MVSGGANDQFDPLNNHINSYIQLYFGHFIIKNIYKKRFAPSNNRIATIFKEHFGKKRI